MDKMGPLPSSLLLLLLLLSAHPRSTTTLFIPIQTGLRFSFPPSVSLRPSSLPILPKEREREGEREKEKSPPSNEFSVLLLLPRPDTERGREKGAEEEKASHKYAREGEREGLLCLEQPWKRLLLLPLSFLPLPKPFCHRNAFSSSSSSSSSSSFSLLVIIGRGNLGFSGVICSLEDFLPHSLPLPPISREIETVLLTEWALSHFLLY